MLTLSYSIGTLIITPIFGVAFIYVIFLWLSAALGYARLEHALLSMLLWPLLAGTGLLYLFRLALQSFWFHGRRPFSMFGGTYTLGELYEWSEKLYDPWELYYVSNRVPIYYDWWITWQNPVLLEFWIDEQNFSLFFRWGSFVRYLFLLAYYSFSATGRALSSFSIRFCNSELGHTVILFCFVGLRFTQQHLGRFFWWWGRSWSRLTNALAGEFYLMAFLRYFRLDSVVRFRWYLDGNVDAADDPERIWQQPPSLRSLRFIWYGLYRDTKNSIKRVKWPLFFGFSNFLAVFLLSLLLLPLAFFSAISIFFLRLWTFVVALQYRFTLRNYGLFFESFETFFLLFPWFLSSFLGAAIKKFWHFPGYVFQFTSAIYLRLRPFIAIIFFLSFFFFLKAYGLESFFIFQFGVGYIFYEFFQQIFFLFITYDSPFIYDYTLPLSPAILEELYSDFNYYALFPSVPGIYHGGWLQGWPPFRGLSYEDYIALEQQPANAARWFARYPFAEYTINPQEPEFFFWFTEFYMPHKHFTLIEKENRMMDLAVIWWSLFLDWDRILSILWRRPLAPFMYSFYEYYYRFIRMVVVDTKFFFWISLAAFRSSIWKSFIPVTIMEFFFFYPIDRFFLLYFLIARELFVFALLGALIFYPLRFLSVSVVALGQTCFNFLLLSGQSLWQRLPSPFYYLSIFWVSFIERLPRFEDILYLLRPFSFSFYGYLDSVWAIKEAFFAYALRWLFWFLSAVYCDLFSFDYYRDIFFLLRTPSPIKAFSHLMQLASVTLIWPSLPSLGLRNYSFFSFALSIYIWFQCFMDDIFLYFQFPRTLDDHIFFFHYRKPLRAFLFIRAILPGHKGAFTTGHQWAISPLFIYRYVTAQLSLDNPLQFNWFSPEPALTALLPLSFGPSLSTNRSLVVNLAAEVFPFFIPDAHVSLITLGPVFYWLGLLFYLQFFSGARFLLFDSAEAPVIYNRQWAWNGWRQEPKDYRDLENFFYFRPNYLLLSWETKFRSPTSPHSQTLFRIIEERCLQRDYLPPLTVMNLLEKKSCMGSGIGSLIAELQSGRRVVPEFGDYLLSPTYKSFRETITMPDYLLMRFISYYYGRSAWVYLAWSHYQDDLDYHYWSPDFSLGLAESIRRTTATLRSYQETADRFFFDGDLGHWLWTKDQGTFEMELPLNLPVWGHLAYESEDIDSENFFPWLFFCWFFLSPFVFFINFYWYMELSWTDYPLLGDVSGFSEIHRAMLLYLNILLHIPFLYEHFEHWNWDALIAEYQKPCTPLTPAEEIPVDGYIGDWMYDYANDFYFVHTCKGYWNPFGFFWYNGTSQLPNFLEEYAIVRFILRIIFLSALALWLVLFFFFPPPALAPQPSWSTGRWSLIQQHFKNAKTLFLWFWK